MDRRSFFALPSLLVAALQNAVAPKPARRRTSKNFITDAAPPSFEELSGAAVLGGRPEADVFEDHAQALFDVRTALRRREFDVSHYGAKGDGKADDASAIRSAIEAASAAGGGTVFLPQGTYFIGSTLDIRSDNISLRGGGFFAGATLTNRGGQYAILRATPDTSRGYRTKLRMERLRVHGQVHLRNCVDFGALECFFDHGHTHTLIIDGGFSHQYVNTFIQHARSGHNVFVTSQAGDAHREVNALDFSSCRIEGGTGGGIVSDAGTRLQQLNVTGGIIEGHTASPRVWGVDIPNARAVCLRGIYFEGNRGGNVRLGSGSTSVEGASLTGLLNFGYGDDLFSPRQGVGIHVVNARGVEIHATSRAIAGPSVVVEPACLDVRVTGHEFQSSDPAEVRPATLLGQNAQADGLSGMSISRNGDFARWTAGLPNGWTKNSGTETVLKDSRRKNSGQFAATLVTLPGSAGALLQRYTLQLDALRGRRCYVGALCTTESSGRAHIRISDGVAQYSSNFHPGGADWRQLGCAFTVAPAATQLVVLLEVTQGTGAVTATFDDYFFNVGGTFSGERMPNATAALSHLAGTVTTTGTASPYVAVVKHDLGSAAYNVMLTPNARCEAWVEKSDKGSDVVTIRTSVPAAVDYLIVPV